MSLVIAALLAATPTLKPSAKVPFGRGHPFAYVHCPAQSLVAARVGKSMVVGKLDVAKGALAKMSEGETPERWPLAFSKDCLLAVGEDPGPQKFSGAILKVTAKGLESVAKMEQFDAPPGAMVFSEDGDWLAVSIGGGPLALYKVDPKGALTRTDFVAGDDGFLRLAWSKGRLLAGSYKGKVNLFTVDTAAGKLGVPARLMDPTAATREKGSLNVDTGAVVMPGGARVFGVEFSHGGSRAWAVVESGQVFAWELGDKLGPRVTVIDKIDGANGLAVSPAGDRLVVTGNFVAQVWKLDGLKASLAADLAVDRVETYASVDDLVWVGKAKLLVGSGPAFTPFIHVYAP